MKTGANAEFTYSDGDKYVGQFQEDGLKHGLMENRDGTSYSGDFKDGKKIGYGVFKLKGVL